MITVVYSLSQFRLPGSPTVMIITAPSQHSSLPSFIFLILLHFYITSTPFPARLSLSPATPLPLPSAPFSHPISYIRVTFLMSPPPNRLSLFMCVWGVGAIQPRFILLPSNLRRNLFLLAVTYIYIYTLFSSEVSPRPQAQTSRHQATFLLSPYHIGTKQLNLQLTA